MAYHKSNKLQNSSKSPAPGFFLVNYTILVRYSWVHPFLSYQGSMALFRHNLLTAHMKMCDVMKVFDWLSDYTMLCSTSIKARYTSCMNDGAVELLPVLNGGQSSSSINCAHMHTNGRTSSDRLPPMTSRYCFHHSQIIEIDEVFK